MVAYFLPDIYTLEFSGRLKAEGFRMIALSKKWLIYYHVRAIWVISLKASYVACEFDLCVVGGVVGPTNTLVTPNWK